MTVAEFLNTAPEESILHKLIDEILFLDPQDFYLDDYLHWNREIDSWCDNLDDLIQAFRTVQITCAKRRASNVNSGDFMD